RAEHPAQFLGRRMNMDQGFAGIGDAEERVALRSDLADPRADREHEIGCLDPRDEAWCRAGSEIADKAGEPIVDDVLAAERAAHWDVIGHREAGDVGAGGIAPAAAADPPAPPLGR